MAGFVAAAELQARIEAVGTRLGAGGVVPWELAPGLGVAWRSPAGPRTRAFLYQEIRARLVKRAPKLGRLPTAAAEPVGELSRRLIRTSAGEGPAIGGGDLVLVAGRTRSKALDFANGAAIAVQKPRSEAITAEIDARNGAGANTTTELLEVDFDGGVFVERLETGFNLAVHSFAPFENAAIELLSNWVGDRRRAVPGSEHLALMERALGQRCESMRWRRLRADLDASVELETTVSHGDLQAANVMATSEGLRLVDFERFSWRVAGFDLASLSDHSPPTAQQGSWWRAEQLVIDLLDQQ